LVIIWAWPLRSAAGNVAAQVGPNWMDPREPFAINDCRPAA